MQESMKLDKGGFIQLMKFKVFKHMWTTQEENPSNLLIQFVLGYEGTNERSICPIRILIFCIFCCREQAADLSVL